MRIVAILIVPDNTPKSFSKQWKAEVGAEVVCKQTAPLHDRTAQPAHLTGCCDFQPRVSDANAAVSLLAVLTHIIGGHSIGVT